MFHIEKLFDLAETLQTKQLNNLVHSFHPHLYFIVLYRYQRSTTIPTNHELGSTTRHTMATPNTGLGYPVK
jgi:hypothetical protein